MEKKRVTCAEARAWINEQLESRPATRGLSIGEFSKYSPERDPMDLLKVGPNAAPSRIAMNTVEHLWKEIGNRFEVEASPVP